MFFLLFAVLPVASASKCASSAAVGAIFGQQSSPMEFCNSWLFKAPQKTSPITGQKAAAVSAACLCIVEAVPTLTSTSIKTKCTSTKTRVSISTTTSTITATDKVTVTETVNKTKTATISVTICPQTSAFPMNNTMSTTRTTNTTTTTSRASSSTVTSSATAGTTTVSSTSSSTSSASPACTNSYYIQAFLSDPLENGTYVKVTTNGVPNAPFVGALPGSASDPPAVFSFNNATGYMTTTNNLTLTGLINDDITVNGRAFVTVPDGTSYNPFICGVGAANVLNCNVTIPGTGTFPLSMGNGGYSNQYWLWAFDEPSADQAQNVSMVLVNACPAASSSSTTSSTSSTIGTSTTGSISQQQTGGMVGSPKPSS